MFPGMSLSIRVGIPTATDPAGTAGPGAWWITGGCRPELLHGSVERSWIRRFRRARVLKRIRKRSSA
jgi:hypothetical protein